MGNGLLEQDNKINAFNPIDNKKNDFKSTDYSTGKLANKFDKKIDKYTNIKSEKELETSINNKLSMVINNNTISFDNQNFNLNNKILLNSNISGNLLE